MKDSLNSTLESVMGWLPHILVVVGISFTWLHLDPFSLLMSIGFGLYAILSFIDGVRRKYYQGVSLKLVKLILYPAIAILAAMTMLTGQNNLMILLLLMMLDLLVLTPRRINTIKQS